MRKLVYGRMTAIIFILSSISMSYGYEITDKFSIGGVLAGAYQYQFISDIPGFKDTGRGAIPFQPAFRFRPTGKDELYAKLGFAVGNALNDETSPFVLSPWAADLEADVKNINGRDRDYLLTAWYKHTFDFNGGHTLALTGGIIDATQFIDQNAYSNDEYTQFMNEALVNGPNGFAPSYDIGGALEWAKGKWGLNVVAMNIGQNDDGNSYSFFGVQVAYKYESFLGEGNYRLIYEGTPDEAFLDPTFATLEQFHVFSLSMDQQFGDIFGGWIRIRVQTDKEALVRDTSLYSGGIDINGAWWGRGQDNIGIAYGYLAGGNAGIDHIQVAEGYIRLGLNRYIALTFDVQYMEDTYDPGAGVDVSGLIASVRVAAEF